MADGGKQRIFVNLPQFFIKEYGALTHLVDKLDIHWYLYIILVLGNCGGIKGLAAKAVVD